MAHFRRSGQSVPTGDATSSARRLHGVSLTDILDAKMGFERVDSGSPRLGWLVNFQPTTVDIGSEDTPNGKSAVYLYFLDDAGGYFKSTVIYSPYFYVQCSGREGEVDEYLKKRLQSTLQSSAIVLKEDLSLANHLSGQKATLIKLWFSNVQDLLTARRMLMPIIQSNQKHIAEEGEPDDLNQLSAESLLIDVKEHDVPYHVRVCIDLDIRAGKWYEVIPPSAQSNEQSVHLKEDVERLERADPVVMAFDIETTKLPLKFPDSKTDAIMMISYMIDGRGYLVTNREIVSQDIEDFEYTPKPEFKGEFTIFNEPTEKDVILRFFEHINDERPTVIATFNGDLFDWPFVDARAAINGLNMYEEIGFQADSEGEYKSAHCVHMDCFRWVKRDSYLPQGSQGLKAVTTAKLGYNPLEIDPEQMTPYAREKPQVLSEYSVSDAVATYYLYMKYVHPFVFSLCTIIPLRPDEVLRKGTGTLCEMLLMVQAYMRNIVFPHKHSDPPERYYNGHLIESETYVGGHVESLEAGVFRADIPTDFNVSTQAIDNLLDQLDAALMFTITKELNLDPKDVKNLDAIKHEIQQQLRKIREQPKRKEEPHIYHVDVASMYPNIMTSNRLQPDSMKSERDCAMCDFNVPSKTCDRRLPWAWRGEFYPAKRGEILMIQEKLRDERFPKPKGENGWRSFSELSQTEQLAMQRKRIADYSRKVYHKMRDSETIEREAIICQRENPFYVNTVRDFRDRRYDFKSKQKTWKQNMSKATNAADKEYASKMVILFDSLQLAHKVILNSFYGYVMRKGSRWYSIETAGVTCLTGATIIQLARSMVERLGRPLELDTDGIWCILPKSFPGDMTFELTSGKKIQFAYPCVMLNHLVHEQFTNHQYQTLVDEKNLVWETSSDNSIFFEIDGPYKAMMLPSSREEGKGLKKRYAVFNFDGSLAELKGFELKRRGELQLIKTFQSQLFSQFLKGHDLKSCYDAVAKVANSWLDVLDSKGINIEDMDLMSLISENKSMSKSLEEYGTQKSSSICTARRLAEFLGKEMVRDKGLACRYIISAEPAHEPVTNRAIPLQIFEAPPAKKQEFLRKWLKKPHLDDFGPRAILDWAYYKERLSATIQKLIVIPAARQRIPNPVPRVPPPVWLLKKIAVENDTMKQQTIDFTKTTKEKANLWGSQSNQNECYVDIGSPESESMSALLEIEDLPGTKKSNLPRKAVVKRKAYGIPSPASSSDDEEDVVAERAPNPDVDYRAWIIYMKRVWKKQKEQYAARVQLFGSSRSGRTAKGVQSMMRQQTESAWRGAGGIWHILQLSPASETGKVKAVAHVNGRLQKIQINVPRQLYILVRQGQSLPSHFLRSHKFSLEKSSDILPSGLTSSDLYKVTMPEHQFQEEQATINGLFNCKAIKQVFEMKVSCVDRVLLKLGSYCRLDGGNKPGLLGKGLDRGFDLDWLVPTSPAPQSLGSSSKKGNAASQACLQASSLLWSGMEYAFVFHNEVHGHHIVTLIASWSPKVTSLEFSARHVGNSEDWSSHLGSEYSAQLELHQPEQPLFPFPQALDVQPPQMFENIRKFWSAVSKQISDLLVNKSRNAMTVVSCDRGSGWIMPRVRVLSEIPHLSMVGSGSYANGTPALPSIGWQVSLARRVSKTFLRSQFNLDSMRVMSVHTNIPVSNIPLGADIRSAIDIIYARKLQEAHHVLWWGEATSNAELSVIDLNNAEQSGADSASDGIGVYPHVCLDMSVSNLVVNTILTSSFLMAAEGGTTIADPEFVVDAFSPVAWRCLVAITKDWWIKASFGDETADLCVQQLAGWVATPSSRLWSPKLAHQIKTLSNKALSQFTHELRKFGTTVVHSERDGQRIVLATTKKSAPTALGFGGLVVKETKSKEQFTYLDISVNEVWDFLIWMNSKNYCGRLLTSSSSSALDSMGDMEFFSAWQIADYLPSILQDEFNEWVLQYMAIVAEAKDSAIGTGSALSSIREDPLDNSPKVSRTIPPNFTAGCLMRLEKPLSNRVRQLQSRYIDSVARQQQEKAFGLPKRAGSRINSRPDPPVLSFVKTLLAVLSSSADNSEFIKLRRSLLAILHVGDFDTSSEFTDPAAKLIVTDIVCIGCMSCLDIDVCHPQPADSTKFAFQCPRCAAELDRVFLEEKLVQMLVTVVAAFQLQDLKCMKCNKIRASNMAQYCSCSGQFQNTFSVHDMREKLDVYRQVGRFYELRLLNDLIAQY